MAWGTLIHGLLEHAMRHPNSTPADLRRLAMWLTVEERRLRPVIDEAIDTVQRVAKADFWTEAQAGDHAEEAPFAFTQDQALMTGVIDLMYVASDKWQVTDYKTDSDGGAAKGATYDQQMATYRQALEACGIAVDKVAIQAVRARNES
jgi:ATP-dependent exoDNAse (exonuclease V) beta subunit